jgi:hypothetical protein
MNLFIVVTAWVRQEMGTNFWLGNFKERDNLEDLSVDGRTILQKILGKQGVVKWTGSRQRQTASFCEHGNEHSCFIKSREFFQKLNYYQLPKKDSA